MKSSLYLLLMFASAALGKSVVFLSAIEPVSVRQGWGTLSIDRSVMGGSLQIGDRVFSRGLGAHANSELIYQLDGRFERFEAWVGVDAAMRQRKPASVVFEVFCDGRQLFSSGVMRADTPARHVSVPVADVSELRLVVTDAGDGIDSDHADWADAALVGQGAGRVLELGDLFPPAPAPRFDIKTRHLTVRLSDDAEIAGARLGRGGWRQALRGDTRLKGCTNSSSVVSRVLPNGGVEFTRTVTQAATGCRATLTDRFTPTKDSVRWEIDLRGDGAPWTTGIQTRLGWPPGKQTRYWTAWDDPEQRHDTWRDPLVTEPLANKRLYYGAPAWEGEAPGYAPSPGLFVIPLLTVVETERDTALSLALSPEDLLLDVSLQVRRNGLFQFTRSGHRLSNTNIVRFAMDLVCHPADWRAGLGWMANRYPDYFNSPNPRAEEIAGLGAYSNWEGALDVAQLKRMGFRVNWKASYDFPYMGMFLPPIADTTPYLRLVKGNTTSIAQLRDYSARMRRMGFYVLNYFNVTEFGATTGMPKAAEPGLDPSERWRNVHNFMRDEVADGILRDEEGHTYGSWEGAVGMDCGGPHYRAFLLDQARRHVERLPDSAGICIDRLDWLRFVNLHADDGVSWRDGQPCRSLYCSWRSLLNEMGPIFHSADKVIFVNPLINRTDLFRRVDGLYHEFGYGPTELNGAALQCVRKPCIAWTAGENNLRPDPDAYFQRHLYLGVFPTAPLPDNDHTITPSPWVNAQYLDYGPLFDLLRGRKWVLQPHVLEIESGTAKANLFEVPGGWLLSVCFGGTNRFAAVTIRNIPEFRKRSALLHCSVLHPGEREAKPLNSKLRRGQLRLVVPLERGCAMVPIQISRETKQ